MRRFFFALFVLSIIVVAPSSGWAAGDSCVISPEALVESYSQHPGKVAQSGLGNWIDGVYVLPYTYPGTYDKMVNGGVNSAPRRWVSQNFFEDSPDAYDFLVVVTNFEWDATAGVAGFHIGVANDVQGIGVDVFDHSPLWGSENLLGYVDIRWLSTYIQEDGSLDTEWLNALLNHEVGHQFLAFIQFLDGGAPSDALLGRDHAHWSYLLDSEASYMYGSNWSDNGDGTFTATEIKERYSHLDLYLMGMIAPEEVPNFNLLVNPSIPADGYPSLGDTIEATTKTISVFDVIAAEGPRIPDWQQAQHEFRVGLIYLVDPAIPVLSEDIARLNEIRTSWEESFFRQTHGRGVIDVAEPSDMPTGGTSVDLTQAVNWLVSVGAGGVWRDSPVTWVRETAEAITALDRIGGHGETVTNALAALESEVPVSTELAARRLLALTRQPGADLSTPVDSLAAQMDGSGGWASFPRYVPDCVTTARVVRALHAAETGSIASEGWSWLLGLQNPDGGWGWQAGLNSTTVATEEVLLAAKRLFPDDYWDFPAVQAAVQWLLNHRVDGGFGEPFPNTEATAKFLLLTEGQGINQTVVQGAVDFLTARQQPNGSWASSAHTTALAINALASFALPDPFVDGARIFADPEQPFDDDEIDLLVTLRNFGLPLDAGTPFRWEARLAANPDVLLWVEAGELPAIDDIGFVTLGTTISPSLPEGVYEIRFIIDPNREIPQRERSNDVGTVILDIRSHPDGVDLEIFNSGLSLDPIEISSIPQTLVVNGVIRNLGLSDATGVVLRVFDGDPADGVVLGETTIAVPALGLSAFSVPAVVTEARSMTITVVADPDRLTDDSYRFNNTASRVLPLLHRVDLEVLPGSFVATPPSILVGEDQVLEAVIRNSGTVAVSDFHVLFSYEWDTPATLFPIEDLMVTQTLEPGETLSVSITWSPNVGGDPLPIEVDVDPNGDTGDADLSNNSARLNLAVPPSDLPNLVVGPESFILMPDPPLQGELCQIGIVIANPTINDAGPFEAQLWLDAVGTGILVGSESFGGLDAGSTIQMDLVWDVVEPEDRLLYVVVDSAGVVVEFREDDNEAFVEPDVQTLPDLVVTGGGISFLPSFPKTGDVVHFDVLVANQGDQASSATLLELVDTQGDVIDSITVPEMEGHTEITLGLDWDTGTFTGDAALRVRVDQAGAVIELFEDNNESGVTVGVQDADIFLSNQIFSPNGDDVKDTTTIFYRSGGEVEIRTVEGRLLRNLAPEDGQQFVVWDGLSNRGNMTPDGLYLVTAGETASWVIVDTNRYSITNELEQRLLVGFLQPRVPGEDRPCSWNPDCNLERSWFTSMIGSPVSEEIYLVERYHAEGTEFGEDVYSLWMFAADQMVELGELPENVTLQSVDAAGSRFVVTGDPYRLLRVPEMTLENIETSHGWASKPWISPDGKWLLWASRNDDALYLDSLENPGETYTFYPEGVDDGSVCGYSVFWTPRGEAIVSLKTWNNSGYFYQVNTVTDPPSASTTQAQDWNGTCGDGGIPSMIQSDRSEADGKPVKHEVGRDGDILESGLDFDQDTLTWLTLEGGGYGGYGEVGGDGYSGGSELSASVFALEDGAAGESGSVNLGWSEWSQVYFSLSNDGDLYTVSWSEGYRSEGSAETAGGSDLSDSNFIWLDSFQETGRAPKAWSPVDQFLTDWRTEEVRGLPLRMDDTLWTPPDTYIVGNLFTAQQYYGDQLPYFTPAANLKMRLKPRVLFGDGGVDLWLLATDRYLESYVLEYSDLDADPDAYQPIGLPSNEALYNERWGTWLPPGNGRYRVRLTGIDRAGNQRSDSRRVTWNGDNDIANLYTESRFLSPRSSIGVKDTLIFHYMVLRPANLVFLIVDSNGEAITEINVAADEIGQKTTTWDGTDSFGNPVADGGYLLVYGEASWPVIVDNAAPSATLRIGATGYARETRKVVDENGQPVLDADGNPTCEPSGRDEYLNEVFGAVNDPNLMDWEYQVLVDEAEDLWQTLALGTESVGAESEVLQGRYAADWFANRRIRYVAHDLAGNETITEASYRNEMIVFTDSEPLCRSRLNPCLFPDRPELEDLVDVGGLFESSDPLILNPYYDTLIVQDSVWTESLDLRLEYREASLAGVPAGPWVEGSIEVASDPVGRRFPTLGWPFDTECPDMGIVPLAGLTALYWDHPTLPQTPVEVRLLATNEDGQEIISPTRLFHPEMPLTLQHIDVNSTGDILRLTNVSDGVVRNPVLQIRRIEWTDNGMIIRWETLMAIVDRLGPGEVAEFSTGCLLVEESEEILRAAGTGGFGGEALSTLAQVPFREGYSTLGPGSLSQFRSGSCPNGSVVGGGLFGVANADPCSGGGIWGHYWINNGSPETISGHVALDPSGVDFLNYELLVDGQPFFTVQGPAGSVDFAGEFDLSQLPEGQHHVAERFTYDGELGLLGQCTRSFSLTIDRLPPILAITEPHDGALICPDDATMAVTLADQDSTPGRLQKVFLDGHLRGSSASGNCATGNYFPFSGGDGSSYTIDKLYQLQPGWHEVGAQSIDRAGFASCATPINVYVPDLPHIMATKQPWFGTPYWKSVFSPSNTMNRALVETIDFSTNTPGTWSVSIERAGTVYQSASGEVSAPDELVEIIWDGTDTSGILAEDGFYFAHITAQSPCGAVDSARLNFQLDATPPTLIVNAPLSGFEAGAVVEVVGEVWDGQGNFQRSVVEIMYLDGGSGEWEVVDGISREIREDPGVLGTWFPRTREPGNYLMRVKAWDLPGNVAISPSIDVVIPEIDPLIEFVDHEPGLFSPNSDGVLDATQVTFGLFQEAVVTLQLVDPGVGVVHTLIDQQTLQVDTLLSTQLWSGEDDSGLTVADGQYQVVMLAEDPAIPPVIPPEQERLTVVVDTIPPAIDLTSPAEGALVPLPLELIGSQVEIHPEQWTLTLTGPEVDALVIATGSGAFDSRTLTIIEDGQVVDGNYVVVFEAVDAAGNRASLARRFTIDNTVPEAEILLPEVGAVVNTINEPLGLHGEVFDEHLRDWTWAYAPGLTPDFSEFNFFRSGTPTEVGGAVDLFAWDASNLPDGPYTLRFSGTDVLDQEGEARRPFIVDNTAPTVVISQPTPGAVIADPLEIQGSVADERLKNWTLTLIPGDDIPMQVGSAPVDGVLTEWILLPPDGVYTLLLEAEDMAGNRSEVSVDVQIQVIPPSPPIIVSADVTDRTDVNLAWVPDVGPQPDAYNVYRDGVLITPVPIEETSLLDAGLGTGTYVYTVRALSQAGVETEDSNPVEVEIDLRPPLANIVLPVDGARIADLVSVFGTASRDTAFGGWRLWATFMPSGGPILLGGGSAPVVTDLLTVWDTSQPSWVEGPYELRLEAWDIFGNTAVDVINIEVDNTPPPVPVLTVAFSQALDSDMTVNDIHVEWALDPIPPDLAGFYLYRNGQLANAPGPVLGSPAPFLITGNDYDDRDLPDGTYTYFVTAADTAENESGASNESDPIVIDTRRPHAVITDPADGSEFEHSTPVTAECEDLDVESVVFEFMPEGGSVWTPLGPPLTGPSPWTIDFQPGISGLYHVRAVASDALGADPEPESVALTETDLPPERPEDLTVAIDGGDIHLEWSPVADPFGDVAGYRVFRDGTLLNPTLLPTDQLEFDDLGLTDAYYNYQVAAVDETDNEGPRASVGGWVRTPQFDWVFPVTSANTMVLEGRSDTYFSRIDFERIGDGGDWEQMASLPFEGPLVAYSSASLAFGFNSYRMRGSDRDGNRSRWSKPLIIVRHDPPIEPTGVAATAADDDVQVAWDASVDPDLAGYLIGRDGELISDIGVPFPYDMGTHVLTASGGTLAEWQSVVDGDDTTAWYPDAETAQAGASWQWTWSDPVAFESVRIAWMDGAYARRFSIEVRVDDRWLWWHYAENNWSTETLVDLGIEATGVRLSVPVGNYCSSCALSEITLAGVDHLQTNQYTDTDLPGLAYEYGVRNLNRWGQKSNEISVAVQLGGTALAPPANLQATPGSCGEISLTWSAPTPPPDSPESYRLYRATGAGEFSLLVQLPTDRLDWLDTGLEDGLTYRYRVTSLGWIDGVLVESDPSTEVSAAVECTTVPPPVLFVPTVAGKPIDWPSDSADIGGRAWPGSDVTLLQDGSSVAFVSIDQNLPDETHPLPGYGDSGPTLALSQDGRMAAYSVYDGNSKVVIRALESGGITTITGPDPIFLELAPDGQTVAFINEISGEEDIYLADVATGVVRRLTDDGENKEGLAFSPDGRSVAFVERGSQRRLLIVDTVTGSVREIYSTDNWNALDWPVFSPDGTSLAVKGDWQIIVFDLSANDRQHIWTDWSAAMTRRPFSADGRYLCWTEYPDSGAETAIIEVYDRIEDHSVGVLSGEEGVFAGTFVDHDTLAFLRFLPAKAGMINGGNVEVVYSSLRDGSEKTLTARVAFDAVAGTDWGGEWSLIATADGSLWIPQQEEILRLFRPTGLFTVTDVPLHPGANEFVARQLFDGASLDSAPIEINVEPDLFGDADVLAVGATPAFPLTGDSVLIDGVVQNIGNAPMNDLVVTLVRVDEDGLSHMVEVDMVDLAPGAYHRVRSTWDTTGLTGDNNWILSADPIDAIPELDEENNSASVLVPLREDLGVEASITTPQSEYQLGEVVGLEITISANGGSQETRVVTQVETTAGELVEIIDDRTLDQFGYSTNTFGLSWPSDRVYPGDYRARVIVTAVDGDSAEAEVDFSLFVVTEVEAEGSADRASYHLGDRALFEADVRNTGQALVSGAVVEMAVETLGGGSTIGVNIRDLITLPGGTDTALSWNWDTAGAPLGPLQFVIRVRGEGGGVLAVSTPYPFLIESNGAALIGSIFADPGQFEPGETMSITGEVSNFGDQGLLSLEVAAEIVDLGNGQVLDRLTNIVDLGVGGTALLSWAYTPTMTRLDSYVVLLSAERLDVTPPRTETLASATFTLVDRTPPDLVLLDPGAGPVCDIVDIRARATDALTSVVRVTYLLDDRSPEILLDPESLEDTVYASRWYIQEGQTGVHTISVFAEDEAGNRAGPVSVDVTVLDDLAPPILDIVGPEDGSCVPGPATVVFSASDANLESLTATLDGEPYNAGDPIPDGPHMVVVTAVDVCGHEVDDLRTFLVDSLAPEVVVTGVEDGVTYVPPVEINWGVTDLNLVSSSATLNGNSVVSPLTIDLEGSYVLEIAGVDCAGHQTSVVIGFGVGSGSVILTSDLDVQPLEVEPPQNVLSAGSVRNDGETDLQQVTINLRLVDPSTGNTVDIRTRQADIAVGERVEIHDEFATSGLNRQVYQIRLEASGATGGGAYDQVLATQNFEVVDLTAPEIAVVSPVTGPACDPVLIRLEVVDGFSGVETAWARIDGNPDLLELELLPGDPDPGNVWGADLEFGPDAGGVHKLEFFAGDFAANISSPIGVEIDVDVEYPVLILEAPADGACVAESVTLTFEATDPNLVFLEANLNGDAIPSGFVLDQDGVYELNVTARDNCGLETVQQTTFVIDTVEPTISVSGVEDGGVFQAGVVARWTADDLNLVELSAMLDGTPVTPPLTITEEGQHILTVTALDCAGNSEDQTLVFTVEGQVPLELSGELLLGADVVDRGVPLLISAEVFNDGGSAVNGILTQVRVVSVATGGQAGSVDVVMNLGVGMSDTLVEYFDTSSLLGGMYRVELWVSGDYAGEPYDLLLDQRDFELLAPTPIPDLGVLGRLLMVMLLIAAAGAVLRRVA